MSVVNEDKGWNGTRNPRDMLERGSCPFICKISICSLEGNKVNKEIKAEKGKS